MKHLFILLTLGISTSIFAAEWKEVGSDSVFKELTDKTEVLHYVYQNNSEAKTTIGDLKQLIYIQRAKWGIWSMPEYISMEIEKRLDVLFADETRTEPAVMQESFVSELEAFVKTRDITIYSGDDGNSFGDCGNLLLHDNQTKQVVTFSVCYSE